MNILLTGATGFLGSYVLKQLVASHQVCILKRSRSDLWRINNISTSFTVFDLDVGSLSDLFNSNHFDVIIHCATTYGRSGDQTASVMQGNILFPMQLIELAYQNGCKYFINTDSFFCKQLPDRLQQGHPLYLPDYTLSKYQFREWGKLRAQQGMIHFINLQMEHLYGPKDNPEKFVPWLQSQFEQNVPSINLTDGEQIRDFTRVEDAAYIYCKVLDDLPHLHGYQSFEIGTSTPLSVHDFVVQMRNNMGASTNLCFGKIPRKPEEIMFSVADSHSPYLISKRQKG